MIEHTYLEKFIIEHGVKPFYAVGDVACVTHPHECSIANCPGNINREKLELFDAMWPLFEVLIEILDAWKLRSVQVEEARIMISKAKELK